MRLMLPPDRGAVRSAARAAVLTEWMTGWLGEPVEVVVAPSYGELADVVARGNVELAWVTPFVAARVRFQVSRLLTIVRYGATGCAATFVVHRDAGLSSLADLRGRRASWVDPLSMNGHLMALKHLRSNGFDPGAALLGPTLRRELSRSPRRRRRRPGRRHVLLRGRRRSRDDASRDPRPDRRAREVARDHGSH